MRRDDQTIPGDETPDCRFGQGPFRKNSSLKQIPNEDDFMADRLKRTRHLASHGGIWRISRHPLRTSAEIQSTQEEGVVIGTVFKEMVQQIRGRFLHREELVRKNKRRIVVGFIRRFGKEFQLKAIQILANGLKGPRDPGRRIGHI